MASSTKILPISQNLKKLNLILPKLGAPKGNYVPYVKTQTGGSSSSLLFISGQIPHKPESESGSNGGGVSELVLGSCSDSSPESLETGIFAAKMCGLKLLSVLRMAALEYVDKKQPTPELIDGLSDDDTDRLLSTFVKRIVKVEGFVNTGPSNTFTNHPKVINGCSDMLCEVLGSEVGSHSRFAVGCASLPLGVIVEIGAVVEVAVSE